MASDKPAPAAPDASADRPPVLWPREALPALLVALVPMTVAVVFALAWPGFALAEDDALAHYQPLLTEAIPRLLSGELPLWSDHTGCGFPLLARSAPLYPVYLLAYGVCRLLGLAGHEVAVAHVLHLGLAAAAAFVFLRALRVGRPAAATAGVAYALAGPMLGMDTNWTEYGALAAYFPLGLLVVERVTAGERSWFWPCFGGLVGGLVFLGASMMGTLKFSLLFGAYFLACCRRETLGPSLVRLAAAGVLGLLCCLGPLLLQVQYLGNSARYLEGGLGVYDALFVQACPPEFYRGFVYPRTLFDWPDKEKWPAHMFFWPRFVGGGLFAGPLAPLALCLAAAHFGRPGRHRALLVLLGAYFLLSLGYYFEPNLLLLGVPVLGQNRWPVRWTIEFTALAALLTGPGLELAWRHRDDPRTRAALYTFLVLVALAVTTRSGLSALAESGPGLLGAVWVLAAVFLALVFHRGHERGFFAAAFGLTLAGLVVNVPWVQQNRFGIVAPMYGDRLALDDPDLGRVLFLASNKEQRGHGEGNYAYNLPHALGGRTVLNYGPFHLRTHAWIEGVSTQSEVFDVDAAARAFLRGHLLDTLRVRYVVVPKDNAALNEACREHPGLHKEDDGEWVTVYRNDGFRAAAFPVREVRKEGELATWDDLRKAPLSDICYVEDDYDGPRTFDGKGRVSDFHEDNGTVACRVEAEAPQFVVVTDSWYPGWRATVDGEPARLYRANSSFMAVAVPAGRHEVRLEYRPEALVWLTWLGVAVEVALLLVCAAGLLWRLWPGVGAPQPS